MTSPQVSLTQSYFDETVVENEDVFDLEPEEAVRETIDQLYKQQQSSGNASIGLQSWRELQREQGVSLTHPESKQGQLDRQRQQCLQGLMKQEEWTVEIVQRIWELLKQNDDSTLLPVGNWFWQEGNESDENQNQSQSSSNSGSVLSKLSQFSLASPDNLPLALRVAMEALSAPPTSLCRSRQEQILHDFVKPSRGWQRLFRGDTEHSQPECQTLWLQLIHQVCQGHEPNKKYCNSKPILRVLVQTLEWLLSQEQSRTRNELAQADCRVLTVICRFDDFSSQATQGQATDSTGMVVSSAHSTVMALGNLNLVHTLQHWLLQVSTDEALLLSILQCLRSMAIQDEMVTRIVSGGILDELQSIFQKYSVMQEENTIASIGNSQDPLRLGILTALIGLYRNLSANDELKTMLCRSPQHSILGPLIATVQTLNSSLTPSAAAAATITKLHEHVCATLGSMALRQPQNAEHIVQDYQGHLVVLKAMESSPHSSLLQRQGALAIRNLASRSTDSMKQALLDGGAEPILRLAATLGAVDEAYAALRDLGCHAVLLQSNPETGQLERQAMFGDKPLQFRPVFD